MSHPELFKRLSKLSIVLLLIAAFFIIGGCRKIATYQDISAGLTDPDVLQAKSWYDITYPANAGSSNTGRMAVSGFGSANKYDYSQHIKPWWQHTAKYSRFGKQVFEVPINPTNPVLSALQNKTTGKFIAPKENSRSSFLIMNSATGYEAYIMTIIADSAYLNGDHSKLNRNTYSKRDTDFSGMVFYFTPKGDYLNGYAYKNGHLLSPSSSSAQVTKSNVIQNIVPDDPPGCTTYWLAYYDSNGDLVSYTYLFQICDPTSGGSPGSNPAPPPPPNCTPPPVEEVSIPTTKLHVNNIPLPPDDGDGFPQPDPPKPDPCHPVEPPNIIDKLTNPCLKNVLAKLQGADLKGKVANIINNVFGTSDQVNLTFQEFNDPNAKPAKSDPPTVNNGVFNVNIYMNLALDAGGSQEYNAEVMIHEILHAYMNYNNQYYLNQLAQHQEMADKYIGSTKTLLQQLFPGFSDPDAYSIILQGFSDIFQGSIPLYYDALKTEFGVTDPTLKTYYKYQLGLSGTVCKTN